MIFIDVETDCREVVVRVDNVSVLLVARDVRDVRDVEDVISVVSIIVLVSDDSVVICVVINEVDVGEIEEEREKEGEEAGVEVGEEVKREEGKEDACDWVVVGGRTRDDVGLGEPVE